MNHIALLTTVEANHSNGRKRRIKLVEQALVKARPDLR